MPAPRSVPTVRETGALWRPSWVEVDLHCIRHNVRLLADRCAPAELCAVVKADGYGHGAVSVARAALKSGATWLAVALVEEGLVLRRAGIDAPILILSEPPPGAMDMVRSNTLTPTLYTTIGIAAAASSRSESVMSVHLKVDTGMHRVGADPAHVVGLARSVQGTPGLHLGGLWTHMAVADDLTQRSFTNYQLRKFDDVRLALSAAGIEVPLVHAANSAATIAFPAARYDLVRCGISIYGYPPSASMEGMVDLRPALSLKSNVSMSRTLEAGQCVSYGLCYEVDAESVIATVPLGYADGVPRRLSAVGGEVLIEGRRRPIAGTVTMDQHMVDCGPGSTVSAGAEVVLLGSQGEDQIDAGEWASLLDTISYEILCGIGSRVPRVVVNAT